jgi:hypothetical protein
LYAAVAHSAKKFHASELTEETANRKIKLRCVHTISNKKRRALVISRNFIEAAKEVLLCGTSASFINRLHADYINIQALLLSCVA